MAAAMQRPLSWSDCRKVTENCLNAEDRLKSITPNLFGHSDHGSLYYLGANPHAPEEQTLLTCSANGVPKPVLPVEMLTGGSDLPLSKEELLLRERLRLRATGITSYVLHAESDTLLFSANDELWWYQPTSNQPPKAVPDSKGGSMDPQFCPSDPDLVSFLRDNSIFVVRISTCISTEVVKDNSTKEGIINGIPSYIIQEEFSRYSGYWWKLESSNGHAIMYEEVDENNVNLTPIVDFTKPGSVDNFACPLAGSENAKVNLKLVEFDNNIGLGTAVKVSCKTLESLDVAFDWCEYIVQCGWIPGEATCWVQLLDRAQERTALVLVPQEAFGPRDLDPQEFFSPMRDPFQLLEIESSVWINVTSIITFFKTVDNTIRWLWTSETTGYRHLVLHEAEVKANGYETTVNFRQSQPITRGSWVVDNLAVVLNKDKNEIYFSGRKDSVLERHLYKLSVPRLSEWLTGRLQLAELVIGDPERLTEPGYYHDAVISPDGKILVDLKSSTAKSPVCTIRFGDGEDKTIFKYPDVPEYVEPELFEFTSEKGHTVYGRIYHASQNNEAKDAPIPTILYVYGGPHVQLVTNKFTGGNLKHSMWSKLGYNVVSFDGRGSAERGLEFEGHLKHRMGSLEIEDQVEGLKYLASQRRYSISMDKVAIYGHSYGGYLSLMGMVQDPTVFKIAIAGAPVTYWEAYDTGYTERYMGQPQENRDGYKGGSIVEQADKFPDEPHRVFLFHGLQDENVHFHNTARLIDSLITLGKPYDLQVYPKDRHGIRSSSKHYNTSILYVLEHYL